MKKAVYLILIYVVLASFGSHAAVYRVNNIPGASADYSSFSNAHTNASPGDTLYVEASATSYGIASVSKRLTIIGAGYFHDVNDSTQARNYDSQFDRIAFTSGSEGSVLYGVSTTTSSTYTLHIYGVDSITIKHCKIRNNDAGEESVYIQNANDIVIAQNFIQQNYSYSSTAYALKIQDSKNVFVSNNIILRGYNTSHYASRYAVFVAGASLVKMVNNVIYGDVYAYNTSFENNIFGKVDWYLYSGNSFKNNVSSGTTINSQNNVTGVNMTDVFVFNTVNASSSFSDDQHWKLLNTGTNPAAGAGTNGVDCGAYGGILNYKKSGMPPIPAIFDANIPSSANTANPMNINIKSMSHQ